MRATSDGRARAVDGRRERRTEARRSVIFRTRRLRAEQGEAAAAPGERASSSERVCCGCCRGRHAAMGPVGGQLRSEGRRGAAPERVVLGHKDPDKLLLLRGRGWRCGLAAPRRRVGRGGVRGGALPPLAPVLPGAVRDADRRRRPRRAPGPAVGARPSLRAAVARRRGPAAAGGGGRAGAPGGRRLLEVKPLQRCRRPPPSSSCWLGLLLPPPPRIPRNDRRIKSGAAFPPPPPPPPLQLPPRRRPPRRSSLLLRRHHRWRPRKPNGASRAGEPRAFPPRAGRARRPWPPAAAAGPTTRIGAAAPAAGRPPPPPPTAPALRQSPAGSAAGRGSGPTATRWTTRATSARGRTRRPWGGAQPAARRAGSAGVVSARPPGHHVRELHRRREGASFAYARGLHREVPAHLRVAPAARMKGRHEMRRRTISRQAGREGAGCRGGRARKGPQTARTMSRQMTRPARARGVEYDFRAASRGSRVDLLPRRRPPGMQRCSHAAERALSQRTESSPAELLFRERPLGLREPGGR